MAHNCAVIKLARSIVENKIIARNIYTTGQQSKGWFFSKEAEKKAGHSTLLADKPDLYEILVDDVKPEKWEEYLKHKDEMMKELKCNKDNKATLVASWKFIAGDVNFRAMHLFRYPEGWTDIDKTFKTVKSDTKFQEAKKFERQLITHQTTEYVKSFSFWPEPEARTGSNIYDVRSYQLRPGSMYDWSNYWARGIRCRQSVRPDIPYAGFFSQLGQLHTIYHIWCYKNLEDRDISRLKTWDDEHFGYNWEWHNTIWKTSHYIKTMSSKLLVPLMCSPTK